MFTSSGSSSSSPNSSSTMDTMVLGSEERRIWARPPGIVTLTVLLEHAIADDYAIRLKAAHLAVDLLRTPGVGLHERSIGTARECYGGAVSDFDFDLASLEQRVGECAVALIGAYDFVHAHRRRPSNRSRRRRLLNGLGIVRKSTARWWCRIRRATATAGVTDGRGRRCGCDGDVSRIPRR